MYVIDHEELSTESPDVSDPRNIQTSKMQPDLAVQPRDKQRMTGLISNQMQFMVWGI